MTWFPTLVLGLGFARCANATESVSSLDFGGQLYAYQQTIRGIPRCPEILETLFTMDTMRRLTGFVDGITMLENEPATQVVRVEFGLFGLRTALTYDRVIDRKANAIAIRLLSYETNRGLIPYPTSFLAEYHVTHDASSTEVIYTQHATTPTRVSRYHQFFVRGQMNRFEHKLREIIEESCP